MSIASGFRAKWRIIMDAADASRGESDDARFAAMAKAADDSDLILTEKAVVGAYQKAIAELRAAQKSETSS
jgi:hypothetical protein